MVLSCGTNTVITASLRPLLSLRLVSLQIIASFSWALSQVHIWASVTLYLDILNLFLKILQLLGSRNN